jgi:hypothetical protein
VHIDPVGVIGGRIFKVDGEAEHGREFMAGLRIEGRA